MAKQEIQEKQRVSKPMGFIMILVGAFFDLLPILLVALSVFVMYYVFDGAFGDAAESRNFANEYAERLADPNSFTNAMGAEAPSVASGLAAETALKAGSGLLAGGATLVVAGPIIYTIGSYAPIMLGYIIFTIWFLFLGVNIWSMNKAQRVIANGIALFIETIPVLNLLPGMTIMVWRHVKVSQLEDKVAHSEKLEKVAKALAST